MISNAANDAMPAINASGSAIIAARRKSYKAAKAVNTSVV